MNKYDVVVVGGGVAGCIAAIELARKGISVAVLEKAALPGAAKPENLQGLLPWDQETLGYLSKLDQDYLCNEISSFYMHLPNRERLRIAFKEPVGFVVKRGPAVDSLDVVLFRLAEGCGVDVFSNAEAIALMQEEGQVREVQTSDGRSFKAQLFLAADGARSTIRRLMGLPPHAVKGVGFGVKASYEALEQREFVIAMGRQIGPGGYGYVLPYPEEGFASIAVCFRPEVAHCRASRYLEHMLTILEVESSNVISYFGGFVPCGDGSQVLHTRNVLFLGEAAALQDPLLGFGIETAARSAQIAAEVVHTCIFRQEPRLLDEYSRRVQRELCFRMSKAHVVSRGLLSRIDDADLIAISKWFSQRPDRILRIAFMQNKKLPWETFLQLAVRRPQLLRLAPVILIQLVAHWWRSFTTWLVQRGSKLRLK